MIYFVGAMLNGEPQAIKIGFTAKDHSDRVSSLQIGNHLELEALATIPGDMRTERELHARFAEHHLRGEWFAPHQSLLARVAIGSLPGRRDGRQKQHARSRIAPSFAERELSDWLNRHLGHAPWCLRAEHMCDQEDHLIYIGCTEEEWSGKCDEWASLVRSRIGAELRMSAKRLAA
jgi:hypothetical protein